MRPGLDYPAGLPDGTLRSGFSSNSIKLIVPVPTHCAVAAECMRRHGGSKREQSGNKQAAVCVFFPPRCICSHFTQCRCNICSLGIAEKAEYNCRLGFIRQINSKFQTARAITEPCTSLASNCQFNLPSLALFTVLLQSFILVPARWDSSALVFLTLKCICCFNHVHLSPQIVSENHSKVSTMT